MEIDYSLDEYSDKLRVQGRCTLGDKTVYGIYVYSKDYAKRKNWCGLYIVEDYLRKGERGEVCVTVFKFPISFMETILGTFLRGSPGHEDNGTRFSATCTGATPHYVVYTLWIGPWRAMRRGRSEETS